ncbi:MAG TPA: bifunctional aspartate kinase/homoserine dehydrogenase I [Rhodanobacteraceae bacterium]|nr:bifunctional aspartate kinase/homoserine dehydrogenase I [Rhodanobacteraceae bacterium]
MKALDSIDSAPRTAQQPPSDGTCSAQIVAHKFGGSSLANAERIRHVAELLRSRPERTQVVVVSAMQGVTDALIGLTAAAAGKAEWRPQCQALRDRHLAVAGELLGPKATAMQAWLSERFDELSEKLHAISVLGSAGREIADGLSGKGEVWSAHLLHALLRAGGSDYDLLDARELLVVRHEELGVAVDWDASAQLLADWRQTHRAQRTIVTGYVAREASGRATVLGRNGSDYSGAIFAALWDAQELHIWTDVDGVLSADPRVEPEAVTLAAMTYEEACELAYFGAKVIHPQTMAPAIARGLPIFIRNTFKPELAGTRIDADGDDAGPVKGLTLAHDLAIVNVEGTGMIGVPGTAERVFAALRAAQVSVVMISQGSSEHSICSVVRAGQASTAQAALEGAFARELAAGQINRVQLSGGIAVLAAVGNRMAGVPGTAARLFDALARARVNIRAIAQGASERNISVAIEGAEAAKALRAAHAAFYLSPQTVSVGVIGPGKVGAALLDQIAAASARLRREANLDLRLRALSSSRRMCLDDRGIAGETWRERIGAAVDACDLDRFAGHVHTSHLPHAIIVDCSASDAVAAHYAQWLAAGIHIVTPNKQAGAGPVERYRAIREAAAKGISRFRYEATVGAGLPIISTLRDLLDTGDEILAIDGIFSGTLAWLFNSYDGSVPFSKLVHQAHALGYTEPDPRDDLSGTDVARKLVILAREAGWELSLADVNVENLVPPSLRGSPPDEFMAQLDQLDATMAQRHAGASANGHVLRYVASLKRDGSASVGLTELPRGHAFANIRLTDNVVQFRTKRYCDNPLVVQGPGAGPEVTAAGVFADLLRVAAALGARV